MKNYLSTTIKALLITAIFVAGVSVAFAWNAPTVPETGGNAFMSLNTTAFSQAKTGGIDSEKYIVAAANPNFPAGVLSDGFMIAKTLIGSTKSLFTHHLLVSGTDSRVKIGGTSSSSSATPLFDDGAYNTPLTIDLTLRDSVGASTKNAMELITDANSCKNNVNILTNAPAVQYYSTKTGDNADIIGRQVRLAGGNPAPGKILIATNPSGDAVWATPKLVNGQITFDTSVSPVTTAQTCTPTPQQCMLTDASVAGCFVAGTQVTMADGSRISIENVKVGDRLKGVHGVNTVESLLRPKLGNQPVYSINGSKEFFTANHPFLSTTGWKSIDPATTKREIPDLVVSKMNVGDILVTETGKVTITSLTPAVASPETQLYNFVLNGDHTYYANGYAVHNKVAIISGGTYFAPVSGHPDRELIKSTSGWGTSCQINSDCGGISDMYAGSTSGYHIACDNEVKVCGWDVVPNTVIGTGTQCNVQ